MSQKKRDGLFSEELMRGLGFFFTVGWTVALSLVVPTVIGWWLDRPEKFDTAPLYTLIGFGVGTVLAFYVLYRLLRRFQTEQKKRYGDLGKDDNEETRLLD